MTTEPAPGPAALPLRPRIPVRRRVRTPTVIQMEAVECGAASLGIILGHLGRFVPLEELRAKCGVSRDGSTAGSVLRAARTFGLEGKGLQLDTPDLPKLALPAILFWKFNHFLVLEGYGRRVWLNDPASGPRSVTWEEFDKSFTGIALQIGPGTGFQRGGERRRVLGALAARRPRLGSVLYLAALLGLIIALAGLATPVLNRVFTSNILLGGQDGLPGLIAALAVATGLTLCAAALQQWLLVRAEAVFALGSAARFVRHLLRLPVTFFDQRQPADLANRVRSNDVVADVLVRRLAATAVDCLLVIAYGVLLVRYDLVLGLLAVAFAGLNVAALRYVSTMRTTAVAGLQADRGRMFGTVYTTIHMIESIKAAGEEQSGFQRFASRAAVVASGQQRLGVPTAALTAVPALLAGLNTALLLWLGGHQILAGSLSIGLLIGMQGLITLMNRPVTNLTVLGTRLQETSVDLARLRDVENYPAPPAPSGHGAPLAPLEGRLRIEGLTFGYNPLAKPVIEGLELDLPPGSRAALVGASGSGKSTIGRVAAGLYEPWSGRITVDGKTRLETDPDLWAVTVAYVDQDQMLFEGSVRDNVTLWDPTIGDADIIAALRDACVYQDIARRPGGLSSLVEEDGRNFSRGQRQRLEIARALIRRPAVIILDEATSALDPATELAIDRNLRRRGATCLIIAHRLSTIRDCDLIVVLGAGGELERGTHEQLMATAGPYAELIGQE
ncbi:MAG: NHLP family bacteriocin export ABC transporter peptidase/permease/ATPase subunit [Trebonia sp.]